LVRSCGPRRADSLFGTGLASTTKNVQGGLPFPTTLGGVQVMIDGYACPLYYVSPTELSVIVPYEVATNQTGLANIQVINNNVQSNTCRCTSPMPPRGEAA
jgi:uncharacterized protein (TIGR03437 family)